MSAVDVSPTYSPEFDALTHRLTGLAGRAFRDLAAADAQGTYVPHVRLERVADRRRNTVTITPGLLTEMVDGKPVRLDTGLEPGTAITLRKSAVGCSTVLFHQPPQDGLPTLVDRVYLTRNPQVAAGLHATLENVVGVTGNMGLGQEAQPVPQATYPALVRAA